jgi:CheY-like chemotaxis protein
VVSRIQSGIKPFDLIFMDIYMPVMNGSEAAAEILKLKTGTPIIALTASSDPGEREQYIEYGMAGCVGKPFTSHEMLECLVKYLKPRAFGPMDLDAADHSVVHNVPLDDFSVGNNQNKQDEDSIAEEKFKYKLIDLFIKNNKTIYEKIIKAIGEGDIELAHRLAHTLKSNAGMLGKINLQKATEDIENRLSDEMKTGSKFDLNQGTMGVFKNELDAALNDFELLKANAILSEKEGNSEIKSSSPARPLSEKETLALITELEILLEGGDTECVNLIDRLRLIPENSVINGTLVNELIHQIEYFEFNLARETVIQLKGKLMEPGDE